MYVCMYMFELCVCLHVGIMQFVSIIMCVCLAMYSRISLRPLHFPLLTNYIYIDVQINVAKCCWYLYGSLHHYHHQMEMKVCIHIATVVVPLVFVIIIASAMLIVIIAVVYTTGNKTYCSLVERVQDLSKQFYC